MEKNGRYPYVYCFSSFHAASVFRFTVRRSITVPYFVGPIVQVGNEYVFAVSPRGKR